MKTKFFKACEGWGTTSLDDIINKWLNGQDIDIIKMEFSTHIEKKTNYYGIDCDVPCQTVLLIYKVNN